MDMVSMYGDLTSQLALNNTLDKVGVAMLSNAMDTQEMAGNGIVQMIDAAAMERSVNPHIGSNFDMTV